MDICGPRNTPRLRRVLHSIGVAVLAIGVETWSDPEYCVSISDLPMLQPTFNFRRGRLNLKSVAKLFKKFPSDYKSLPRFEAQACISFENDVVERAGGLMEKVNGRGEKNSRCDNLPIGMQQKIASTLESQRNPVNKSWNQRSVRVGPPSPARRKAPFSPRIEP
jgi:hypothetical protein